MIVATASGKIEGRREGGLEVFAGIPFADPPVGALRFVAPQPVRPWDDVLDATEFRGSPPTLTKYDISEVMPSFGASAAMDEDCLYLNVWTPGREGAGRPVMVWIYGGGFQGGSACCPWYDGSALAADGDVVVVSGNYRVGALGFTHFGNLLGAPGDWASNAGLLDQIALLEWVRDNIEQFGGDPGNVTIFGESAGGMSVSTLMGTPRAHGLFHRAIAQSCVSFGDIGIFPDCEQASAVAEQFLQELEIDPSGAIALRDVPLQALLEAQLRVAQAQTKARLPFSPVVDGEIVPVQPVEGVRAGCCDNVPFMVGSTRDELKLHVQAGIKAAEQMQPGEAPPSIPPDEMVLSLVGAYSDIRGPDADPMDTMISVQGDRIIRIPSIRFAEAHVGSTAPTYMYLFTYCSPNDALGACHALELPILFGTTGLDGMDQFTGSGPAVDELGVRMRRAWASFARTGVPEAEGTPPWPTYDVETRRTMIIDHSWTVESDPFGRERAAWGDLI